MIQSVRIHGSTYRHSLFWDCLHCGGPVRYQWSKPDDFSGIPYSRYLQHEWWLFIRKLARERWENACALCSTGISLETHHRNYRNLGRELPADLLVLCTNCHSTHHGIMEPPILTTPTTAKLATVRGRWDEVEKAF